jgi:hypothetical protein
MQVPSTLRVHLQVTPQRRERGTPQQQAAMIFFGEIGSEERLGKCRIRGCDSLMLIGRTLYVCPLSFSRPLKVETSANTAGGTRKQKWALWRFCHPSSRNQQF